MIEADIVFPAFIGAYALSAFIWPATLVALASEVGVFRFLEREASFVGTIGAVVGANVVSWLVGMILASYLPSGLVPSPLPGGRTTWTPGPLWPSYAAASFVVACALSCLIEYAVLFVLRERMGFRRLLGTVVAANVVGYVVLVAVAAGIFLLLGAISE